MNKLSTKDNFYVYLNRDFVYTYLQFRLKYFIHDNQDSPNYRKLPMMWNGFLVGLENAYIIGLAKVLLPLSRNKKGEQRFPNEVCIETWIPDFKIRDQIAKEHLKDWRDKVLAHIEIGMSGMHNRAHMTSLMNEALEAMATIARTYEPHLDYKLELEKMGEQSEKEFSRLLEVIKTMWS